MTTVEAITEAIIAFFNKGRPEFLWVSITAHCETLSCYGRSLNSFYSYSTTTPLSNLALLPPLVIAYLLVLLIFKIANRFHHPHSDSHISDGVFHNLLLAAFSLGLNIYTTRTIISEGPLSLFCTNDPPTGATALIFYVFYLSKWYELLDSFIIVERGGKLGLLHLWHHSSVLFETWSWNEFGLMYAIYGVWFNTFVHVFMYTYYALALLGKRVWWKKWLTTLQIVQFCCSFVLSVPFVWMGGLTGECRGRVAFSVSVLCNGSYLWLFLRFYKKTYKKEKAKRRVMKRD
eukprot:Plantae.Rhodophyta-Hildenbrandia_rubra.ctg6125.p1 GENE.Plantae.Rhodophyta-Hildenbrandia_rubra.ctg6125~~Plantae.Rhodophyta-Hildenbrandia_rubra.ctg6125.p1  ORF type:complete len:289 (-),score=11.18 Plantae.Rhodophyta-Hildenbrandia_rubra.ctg6125:1342-2208(-)